MSKSFRRDVEESLQAYHENRKRIKEKRSKRLTRDELPANNESAKPWRVKQ